MSSPDTPPERLPPGPLAEHFFRRQSGRLTALLTRVLGPQRLELVEDVVQGAFLQALGSWGVRGVPDDPGAWLFRVARNLAIDALRRERRHTAALQARGEGERPHDETLLSQLHEPDDLSDDQLRLLVLCCHPALAPESQIALALRLVSGFSAAEIARALLTTVSNAEKRITRAKEKLRSETIDQAQGASLLERLPIVMSVIYLLFNEGYSASRDDRLVRSELCEEALRLGGLLTSVSAARTPAACALMALMCFHAARLRTRETEDGRALLLDEQPRAQWHQERIREGLTWLQSSASGDELSPYHLEAAIASEHCLAPCFAQTRWGVIVELYERLIALQPTPVNRLNHAVAVAYAHGPLAGLAALRQIAPAELPPGYHLWDAVAGELHRRAGNTNAARSHLERALQQARSAAERTLLRERLGSMPPAQA